VKKRTQNIVFTHFEFLNDYYLFKAVRFSLLLSIIIGNCFRSSAQSHWKYNTQVNAGAHLNLTYGKGQKFPGLKIFSGFSVATTNRDHLILSYGPSLSIYTKTIGANLNPLVSDIQIDFTNSFSVGYAWGGVMSYMKYFRTVHTGDYYNISINNRNAILLTSNFILNNHKRNQIVGSISTSFSSFTFNYYNDGAFPFDLIPVADNFDRYWTGGGGLFIHNKNEFNRLEVSFDQFTGYTPLLYELSHILGINIPLYSDANDKENKRTKLPSTFNTSTYQVKVFTDKNYAVDVGAIGSLTNNETGYHFGIQDLIHMSLKLPLHPNNDITRFFFGASYNYRQHVK
jgi:hypothetical protein